MHIAYTSTDTPRHTHAHMHMHKQCTHIHTNAYMHTQSCMHTYNAHSSEQGTDVYTFLGNSTHATKEWSALYTINKLAKVILILFRTSG